MCMFHTDSKASPTAIVDALIKHTHTTQHNAHTVDVHTMLT